MQITLRNQYKNLIYIVFFMILSVPVLVRAQTVADLWIYVQNDRDQDVKTLLSQGLDPNTRTNIGNPILMQAVRDGAWDVFDVVLENPNTEIGILNAYQETPLMYVSIVGNLERAKKLVAKGAEINHLGWTPLHYAASKGHTEVVEFLLAKGAMPNAPAPDGTSPLMMAARSGSVDVVQALLKAGADPLSVTINGEDAISIARSNGHESLANALVAVAKKRRP